MKKTLSLLLAVSMIIGINGCKKDKEEIKIMMTSPEEGKTYPNSGALAITGKITGHEIDEVEITIRKKSTGEKVFEFEKHIHAKSYDVNHEWTWDASAITEATLFEIEIHVTEEHDGDAHVDLEYDFFIEP